MANTTLHIHLNGKETTFPEGSTLADIIHHHQLDSREVALCVNDHIIPRSQYNATAIAAGDIVELVHFIGGG